MGVCLSNLGRRSAVPGPPGPPRPGGLRGCIFPPVIPAHLAEALAGQYTIQRELGGGGSATVYLALDLKHRRQVAVKVLRPEFTASLAAERFLREISTVAGLQHPHILPLLDSGSAAGFLYFVMPYVEGETLRARLRREGRLAVPDAIRILADVTDAVAHAHDRGVVHRDLKPENILLSGRHAVVTDFGVARAASMAADSDRQLTVGVALGTPAYMSPEQAVASPDVDHRADVYALGVLGYELLAGRPPFAGGTPQDVLTMQVAVQPEPLASHRPDVPPDLTGAVMRCLEKRPEDRWPSAGALLERLEPLATPGSGVTPAGLAPAARRPRPIVIGGAVTVLAGLVALAVLLQGRGDGDVAETTMARPEQVTFFGNVVDAALSPDGQFLAYSLQDSVLQRIYVRDTRSGGAIEIASDLRIHGLRWSADGAEVRYVAGLPTGRVGYAVPRLGGERRVLTVDAEGMSPDGRRTVFVRRPGLTLEFRGPAPSDSSSIPVPWELTFSLPVQWTRDGSRVAIPLLGPTGSQRSAIAIARPAGRVTIIGDEERMVYGAAWGPSGTDLFVIRQDGPTFTVYRYDIDPSDRVRGPPVEVASGVSPFWPEALMGARLIVAPAGDRLLYVRALGRSNVGLLDIGADPGSSFRELTSGTADHLAARLSPDGRRMAFIRAAGPHHRLFLRDLAGGQEELLGEFETSFMMSWSPDGSRLALAGSEPGEPMAYHVFRPGTGERARVLSGAAGPDVHWFSADSLVYQRNGNQRLGIIDLQTGRDSLLSQTEAPGFVYFGRAHPRGDVVVFRWVRPGQPVGLWAAGLRDTTLRLLRYGVARPVRWSPDGRRLWTVDTHTIESEGALTEFTWPSGATRVLDTIPFGFQLQDLSPDGRTMLLTRLERQTDVWSIALPPGGRARPASR